jgi:hypothetical protein
MNPSDAPTNGGHTDGSVRKSEMFGLLLYGDAFGYLCRQSKGDRGTDSGPALWVKVIGRSWLGRARAGRAGPDWSESVSRRGRAVPGSSRSEASFCRGSTWEQSRRADWIRRRGPRRSAYDPPGHVRGWTERETRIRVRSVHCESKISPCKMGAKLGLGPDLAVSALTRVTEGCLGSGGPSGLDLTATAGI